MMNKLPPRIKSKLLLDTLFAGGQSKTVSAYPLKAVYCVMDSSDITTSKHREGLQVMFSVSKRLFKHAVDRNRVKRQMRETLRINQNICVPEGKLLLIAFIWIADRHHTHGKIDRAMTKILGKLNV